MLVKELSEELDMQFIISTHMTQLKEYADKSFEVENGSLIF
jgi:ABC-type lipoprotein export system ATPase subunit